MSDVPALGRPGLRQEEQEGGQKEVKVIIGGQEVVWVTRGRTGGGQGNKREDKR